MIFLTRAPKSFGLSLNILLFGLSFTLWDFGFVTAAVANATPQKIEAENAWATAVPEVSSNSAAYFKIFNKSNKAVELVGAKSLVAKTIEIHNHIVSESGSPKLKTEKMAKMVRVPTVSIPAQGSMEFKPLGLHLMLIGLTPEFRTAQRNAQAKPEGTFELKLLFSDGTSQVVKAKIRPAQELVSPEHSGHH